MHRFLRASLVYAALASAASLSVQAAEINLADWAFHVDGDNYEAFFDGLGDVPGLDASGFDDLTGLGDLIFKTSAAGSHTFIAFLDHDIDDALNGYDNENGDVMGALPVGQSYEIDEPFLFGDIYDNVLAGMLDNTNAIDTASYPLGEDVSMALGFDFTLLANEMATVNLTVSEIAPTSGFYLTQFDNDSDAAIYFSGSIATTDVPPSGMPMPGTLLLAAVGLAGLGAARRNK